MSSGAGGSLRFPIDADELYARICAIADPIIAMGGSLGAINVALGRELGLQIGPGGSGVGVVKGGKSCPYCDAEPGGGHGGLCPKGWTK